MEKKSESWFKWCKHFLFTREELSLLLSLMSKLFDKIPTDFGNEEELRRIWSLPDRKKFSRRELSEAGYSVEQLENLKILFLEKTATFLMYYHILRIIKN